MTDTRFSRRAMLAGAATGLVTLAAPGILRAQDDARRNASSFVTQNWQDHFDSLGSGAIVCDTTSRALHYWNSDATDYRVYPTSVPMTDDLTRTGYSKIVRKKIGPDWTPTPNMRAANPDLPAYMPPGPGNPLGTHAMYLTWPAYLIHGTHDTRKIGRKSSSGCIGLYNAKIEELFALTPVGMQVRII